MEGEVPEGEERERRGFLLGVGGRREPKWGEGIPERGKETLRWSPQWGPPRGERRKESWRG